MCCFFSRVCLNSVIRRLGPVSVLNCHVLGKRAGGEWIGVGRQGRQVLPSLHGPEETATHTTCTGNVKYRPGGERMEWVDVGNTAGTCTGALLQNRCQRRGLDKSKVGNQDCISSFLCHQSRKVLQKPQQDRAEGGLVLQ